MKTISEIRHERLLELLAEAGSVKAFADRTGKSLSQISQLKSRTGHSSTGTPRGVGDGLAREFENAFDKPTGWMDTPAPGSNGSNISAGPVARGKVPMISLMEAGLLERSEPASSHEWVTAWHTTPGARSFGLRVEGDSMASSSGSPSFPAGTTIIVDPDRKAQSGDYVIARDPQGRPTFKQLMGDGAAWYLRPLNPAYPTVEIDEPELRVIGVVIEYAIGGKL